MASIAHFLLVSNNIHCLDVSQFIQPPTERHLCCFPGLAVMSKAAVNICAGFCVDVSFQLTWVNTEERDCWISRCEYV